MAVVARVMIDGRARTQALIPFQTWQTDFPWSVMRVNQSVTLWDHSGDVTAGWSGSRGVHDVENRIADA